jgi:hypothetical protein
MWTPEELRVSRENAGGHPALHSRSGHALNPDIALHAPAQEPQSPFQPEVLQHFAELVFQVSPAYEINGRRRPVLQVPISCKQNTPFHQGADKDFGILPVVREGRIKPCKAKPLGETPDIAVGEETRF